MLSQLQQELVPALSQHEEHKLYCMSMPARCVCQSVGDCLMHLAGLLMQ